MEPFNSLCGVTQNMLVDWCVKNDFPGTKKWESCNPIWLSFVPPKKSPYDAWNDRSCIERAVYNMFWIITKSIIENKYKDFVKKHMDELKTAIINNECEIVYSSKSLLQLVLARFTIAKIAPKVTALRATDMYKIIEDSEVDISNGVYLPMAGFGGIKGASELWFKNHNIQQHNGSWDYLIECYDINKKFCNYYGWKERDVLSDVVTTDKTCVVCPPFGKKYEHWNGTPDEMSDIDFVEWCRLIKMHVISPNYIFVGPELRNDKNIVSNKGLDSSGNQICGLFSKKLGIQLWTDDMIYAEKKTSH